MQREQNTFYLKCYKYQSCCIVYMYDLFIIVSICIPPIKLCNVLIIYVFGWSGVYGFDWFYLLIVSFCLLLFLALFFKFWYHICNSNQICNHFRLKGAFLAISFFSLFFFFIYMHNFVVSILEKNSQFLGQVHF